MKKIYLITSLLLLQTGAITVCADEPWPSPYCEINLKAFYNNAIQGNWDGVFEGIRIILLDNMNQGVHQERYSKLLTDLLIVAIGQTNLKIIVNLIKGGAQLNSTSSNRLGSKRTPLIQAFDDYIIEGRNNAKSFPLIRFLLERGANPLFEYDTKKTAVDFLVRFFYSRSVSILEEQRAEELLNHIKFVPATTINDQIVVRIPRKIVGDIKLDTVSFNLADKDIFTWSTFQELRDEGKKFVAVLTKVGEKWHANLFEKEAFDTYTQPVDPTNQQEIKYAFNVVVYLKQ